MPAYEFNLPVDPGGMPPVIHLAQYDTGRTYYAKLKQGGDYYYTGLGVTAKIKGRNARGVCWELPCTIDTSLTYKVSFTPEGAATDQFGIMPVQMELTDSQGVISTLLMVWDIQRAGYTSEEAVTSPEFETALEAAVAAAIAQQGLGFTEEFKQALLACFNNVAWATPDGQSLVNDLEDALYPEVHLTSITADYEQDRPILDTDSLDLVRLDLVVTANYSDGTSERLADDAYELSGTLTAGTSTITVEYGGKTAEISVVVTHDPVVYRLPSAFVSDGTNMVDTNVTLESNEKYTVYGEFTITSINRAQSGGKAADFVFGNRVGSDNDYVGLQIIEALASPHKKYMWGVGIGYSAGEGLPVAGHKYRFVVIMDTSTAGCAMSLKDVTAGTTNTYNNTYSATAMVDNKKYYLGFGSGSTTAGGFNGTVSEFVIEEGEMSSSDITAYLEGS